MDGRFLRLHSDVVDGLLLPGLFVLLAWLVCRGPGDRDAWRVVFCASAVLAKESVVPDTFS